MEASRQPWVEIERLLELGDDAALEDYVEGLSPGDTARAFARLDASRRHDVLTLLPATDAAAALEELPESQAAEIIEDLASPEAATILHEFPSDERADLLSHMATTRADAILDALPADEAAATRQLASYSEDCAGGLMVTEFLSYPLAATSRDVIDDLQRRGDDLRRYEVQYIYVSDADGVLRGVVPLRSLVLADRDAAVATLMIREPSLVGVDETLDDLRDFFEVHSFFGAPVVDDKGRLQGVVRRTDVQEALETRSGREHLKSQGIIGGDELRTMSVFRRSTRRLSWLSINILLNLLAASIIALYQDTISAVIALAVFLPIISDMSGCSGNQAVAVSLRELTAGLVRPIDAGRVWLKEVSVGLVNGVVLGALIALAAWLWQGNPYLGAVVGGALALNTVIAVSIGGVIPLALKRFSMDPALASGPILTTVTDMSGFLLLLGAATLALPLLLPG